MKIYLIGIHSIKCRKTTSRKIVERRETYMKADQKVSIDESYIHRLMISQKKTLYSTSLNTGRKLNVRKAFRRCPGRLLNVLRTFNVRPVSRGQVKNSKLLLYEEINCYINILVTSGNGERKTGILSE